MAETPQIIPETGTSPSVTETSPLLNEDSRTETVVEINQEPVAETEGLSGTSEQPTSVQITTESSDEFRPAVDCTQTTASPHASGSGEHENLEDSLGPNRCCAVANGIFECWYSSTRRLSNSMFVIPLQIILLVLPVSAGYMGATYMDDCPVSAPTPLLVFMMGLVGIIVIFCRIWLVVGQRFIPSDDCANIKSISIFGCFALILFFCTELLCFSKVSPDFESGVNFCHKTFYHFTYYANFAFLGVFLCVTLLYLPLLIVLCGCHRGLRNAQAS